MHYPLHRLDYLIFRRLHPQLLKEAYELGIDNTIFWEEALEKAASIKVSLLDKMIFAKRKKEINVIILTIHAGCINLADTISQYNVYLEELATDIKETLQWLQRYENIQRHLLEAVSFMAYHFAGHFDNSQYIPKQWLVTDVEKLDSKLEEIKMLLPGLCGNDKLSTAVLLSLNEFTEQNRSRPYTYRKFAYLKELLLSLEGFSIISRSDEFCVMLEKLLMEMNFNHPFFTGYISNKLYAKAEEYETIQEKIKFWRGCQKEFAPFEIKPSLSLNPDAPSLKTSLTEIITSEVALLEKQTMQQSQHGTNVTMKDEKIETKLSVSQLAVFLRLVSEEGIIVHKNQSDIFRRVAATFQTAKTDAISVQSLRGKYHSPERAATDIVKDYLIGMMNRLRRY